MAVVRRPPMATRWWAPEEPVPRSGRRNPQGEARPDGFHAEPRARTTSARLLLLLGRL
jgi:hypothetical protein